LEIIIYQVVEEKQLKNKAGLFKDRKHIQDLDYAGYRLLADNGIDILNCKNNDILNKLL